MRRLIDYLISKKNLIVTLLKVEAHSNDTFNDLADNLVNKARDLSPITFNVQHIPDSLMSPLWDSICLIDHDICKFAQNIMEAVTFNSYLQNKSI